MNLHVKLLSDAATLPNYGTDGAAGLDLYASTEVCLSPGSWTWVDTDVAMGIPVGYVGIVKSRSSMASREVYTEAGVIDSDYRGHVKVHLRNQSNVDIVVKPKMKIAQLVVIETPKVQVVPVSSLEQTARGDKGFGSTGE